MIQFDFFFKDGWLNHQLVLHGFLHGFAEGNIESLVLTVFVSFCNYFLLYH